MSRLIYSTSATILYLMHIEKLSMREIRTLLGERLRVTRLLLKGKRDFTKQNYLDIISKYPTLEGHVENFENVKLKDK